MTACPQVWCEDAQSLALKSSLVRSRGLRGVGCWTADMLYPNASVPEQAAVWGSMRPGETRGTDVAGVG